MTDRHDPALVEKGAQAIGSHPDAPVSRDAALDFARAVLDAVWDDLPAALTEDTRLRELSERVLASARADERRKVAEEIAAAIEGYYPHKDSGLAYDGRETDDSRLTMAYAEGLHEAANLAREHAASDRDALAEEHEFVIGALGNLITDCWRQANAGFIDPAYADTARDIYERFKDGRLTIAAREHLDRRKA